MQDLEEGEGRCEMLSPGYDVAIELTNSKQLWLDLWEINSAQIPSR